MIFPGEKVDMRDFIGRGVESSWVNKVKIAEDIGSILESESLADVPDDGVLGPLEGLISSLKQ